MKDRYFAFLVEVLSKPGSELWNDNQQGGFGWFFVRAVDEITAIRELELELARLGHTLKSINERTELYSVEQLERKEHRELFRLLKSERWQVQYKTIDTYPFGSIE